MEAEGPKPELTVVIGAHGAGKTTWTRKGQRILPKPFYNADSIAEGLGDANDRGLQRQAREIVDNAIDVDLAQRRSFGFESTYSGASRPAIVQRAKKLGYTTHAIFIGTEHHAINVSRVKRRVEEGGHDVAKSEIVRRWKAAWENLLKTWDCFDRITIMDNSGSGPRVIAEVRGPMQHVIGIVPEWASAIVEPGIGATPGRTRE